MHCCYFDLAQFAINNGGNCNVSAATRVVAYCMTLNRKVQCCFSADNLVSCLLIMSCDAGIACSSILTDVKLTNGVCDVKPA